MYCKIAGVVFAIVVTVAGAVGYKPVEKCNGGLMDVALKGCDGGYPIDECPAD